MSRPKINLYHELHPTVLRLVEIMQDLNLTRTQFANKLGFSYSAINNFFNREGTKISTIQAKAMELEFGVRHKWILEGIGSKWREDKKPSFIDDLPPKHEKPIEPKKSLHPLMTVREAAERLRMSPHTIRYWLCSGYVKRLKIGGRTFIARKEVEELLSSALRGDIVGKPEDSAMTAE